MRMKLSQLRRIIRESIKDLFVPDPDYKWGGGTTERHHDADTMFMKNWDQNLEMARQELLPQLSPGAEVLDAWRNRSKRSGDLQVYIPNPMPEDEMVMKDYGFKEAHPSDISRSYANQTGKLFVRTVSSPSNYASFMD